MHVHIHTIHVENYLIEYILLAVHYNKQLYLSKGNKRGTECPGCEITLSSKCYFFPLYIFFIISVKFIFLMSQMMNILNLRIYKNKCYC